MATCGITYIDMMSSDVPQGIFTSESIRWRWYLNRLFKWNAIPATVLNVNMECHIAQLALAFSLLTCWCLLTSAAHMSSDFEPLGPTYSASVCY